MAEAASGLATAARLALGDAPADDAPPAAQLGLFGGQIEDADGPPASRGRGRPPGSRNRSTEDWRQFLLSRFRSPLVTLAELASSSPAVLAEQLGIERAEAAALIIRAAESLAPYLHSKQPIAVEASGGGFQIIINTGAPPAEGERVADVKFVSDQLLDVALDAAAGGGSDA